MNASVNTALSAIPSTTAPTITATPGSNLSPVLQAIYSTISVVAILGNTMTIFVFVLDKKTLEEVLQHAYSCTGHR